ncbi:distal tail protein Dit [Corticicoccus populi]|uniref:Distal tail protein Dit n=1 Tax=Corticicoccus populi TaxID=1812821 RepID=A0ABW5WV02_9STAP
MQFQIAKELDRNVTERWRKLTNLYIENSFEIPSLNTEIETREIQGRNGFILGESKVNGYNFSIPFVYVNHENEPYQDIVNKLVEHFTIGEEVRLRFDNEYWYWLVRFHGTIQFKQRTQGYVEFELNCLITDPFKHSNELFNTISEADHLTIYNQGTAPTYPVFTATAKKNATMLMISKADEDYFMIGESEDTEKATKDLTPYKFNDEFNNGTFRGWNYTANGWDYGTALDGGDASGGRFSFNPNSIYVSNWGEAPKTNWHGASIQKGIGESLQDFSMRFKIQVRGKQHGAGKTFTYLYDEQNRLVFSVGYADTATSSNMGAVVVNAYNRFGDSKRIFTRHMAGSDKRLDRLAVFMHLERKGKRIKITTYNYDDLDSRNTKRRTVVRNRVTKTYNDTQEAYQSKVRVMHIYQAKNKNREDFQRQLILGISIQQLLPANSNDTPYIIKKGDEIVIDNHNNYISINEEPMTHLKDFGSNYYSIDPNLTEIFILPENSFEIQCEWRNRFY